MEGLKLVRADLGARLDALETGLAARGALAAAAEARDIAVTAGNYGLMPAKRLAEGLAGALGQGCRGAAVRPWIDRLRDSIGCDLIDEQAETRWLASVMVRLAC